MGDIAGGLRRIVGTGTEKQVIVGYPPKSGPKTVAQRGPQTNRAHPERYISGEYRRAPLWYPAG